MDLRKENPIYNDILNRVSLGVCLNIQIITLNS